MQPVITNTMMGTITDLLKKGGLIPRYTDAESAYNKWAALYDEQPGNLMLDLDENIFSEMLAYIVLENKTIADIGCGTGRHWKKILDKQPQKLIGYDVSEGMLGKLVEKFPDAMVFKLSGNKLTELPPNSVDILISTLTIAHIEDVHESFNEWNRVLKPGGIVIITDYHPTALGRGAKRTFKAGNKTLSIKNYLHPINSIYILTDALGWEQLFFIEKNIDENVRHYYEAQNALDTFRAFEGVPIIYGMMLKKPDVN